MLILVLNPPNIHKVYLLFITDTNRQLVVDDNDLDVIIQQLEKPGLILTAIPVLYNVCVDFGAFSYNLVLNLSV